MKHRLITILLIITLLTSVGIGNVCAEGLRGNTIDNGIFAWELEEDGTYALNTSIDPDDAWFKETSKGLPSEVANSLRNDLRKLNKLGYYLISLKLPKGYKSLVAAIVAGKGITTTLHGHLLKTDTHRTPSIKLLTTEITQDIGLLHSNFNMEKIATEIHGQRTITICISRIMYNNAILKDVLVQRITGTAQNHSFKQRSSWL